MKRNIINRVADLMLSNDSEMQSLARNMFLENNPRDSDIAVLENVIHNKLNPVESRFSKLEADIRRRQSPHSSWASGMSATSGSFNTAIGTSYSSPINTWTGNLPTVAISI